MKTLSGRSSGFTLIEIIIVVVILGILAAVALPKVTENIGRSVASEAFRMGGAVSAAYNRCLENSAGGNVINVAAGGDIDNCTTGVTATQWTTLGMTAPPPTNFTYTFTSANNINPLVFRAAARPGEGQPYGSGDSGEAGFAKGRSRPSGCAGTQHDRGDGPFARSGIGKRSSARCDAHVCRRRQSGVAENPAGA